MLETGRLSCMGGGAYNQLTRQRLFYWWAPPLPSASPRAFVAPINVRKEAW